MHTIQGLYTAIVTPFDEQQQLDVEALRHLIRFQIEGGVDGIVVLGTTGEAPTLTHEEKVIAIRTAREETLGKVHFMVGTGSYSTAQTIQSTREAKDMGADSVLIVTPYYNRPTQEGIYLHFKAVSEAVDIPVVVYNNQIRTAQNIQTDTLVRIADLPTICGVKEASGSMNQIMEVIERIGRQKPEFSIMCGDDILTVPSMAMGGHGILSIVGNLIPVQLNALVCAAQSNDYEQARALNYQLMPLIRMTFMETNPIPIKAAMRLVGMNVGRCRLPLSDLVPENEKKLRHMLAEPAIAALIDKNLVLYRRCAPVLVGDTIGDDNAGA